MPYTKTEGKTALALFVDGHDVKFAHLSMKGKTIYLHDVQTVVLPKKLEERTLDGGVASLDSIDLLEASADSTMMQDSGSVQLDGETNGNVILGLLAPFPSREYDIVYSITEPSVYYQSFEDSFGLSGVRLKRRLIDELAKVRASRPNLDAVEYIPASEGQILAIIREDGLSLLDLFESIQDFIGKRIPKIPFIETSDISLINIVRSNYEIGAEEISIIVYVGSEFSRLIFLKGNEFFHFAPAISEGKSSPNIENTLYSRILLEQDSAGIARIDRIFLAGEAHKAELKQFLSPQFAEATIDYLVPATLDTTEFTETVAEIVSEYAIPISAAMRSLDTKNSHYYRIDLLPTNVREGQKVFKLAWHGYLFLLFIFGLTFYFTYLVAEKTQELQQARRDLTEKEVKLEENQRLQEMLDELTGQNQQYIDALVVYDSVVPNYNRWSKVFYRLTTAIDEVKSVWITGIEPRADNTLELKGCAVDKSKIPRIASMFEETTLQSVDMDSIRGKAIYKFVLQIKKIDADN